MQHIVRGAPPSFIVEKKVTNENLSRYIKPIKEALAREFNNKCAYCEQKLGSTSLIQLECFYPKSKFPPEIVFKWENLLPVCQVCNISKSDYFPIDENGKPLLINPSIDYPDEHIQLNPEAGTLEGLTEKGEQTIRILSLNRNELVESRKHESNSMEMEVDNDDIPPLQFENLPEKVLHFLSWDEVHDWAQKEVKAWEHWSIYMDKVPLDIRNAYNSNRHHVVLLWGRTVNFKQQVTVREKQFFKILIRDQIALVNATNPIVSYSSIGQEMINAFYQNPSEAVQKFAINFVTLRNDLKNNPNQSNEESAPATKITNNLDIKIDLDPKKIYEFRSKLNDGKSIASFSNDQAYDGDDRLSIKNDVNALAKVISYKETPLPLAIGLFGKWGSGKSFFMHELEKKITSLNQQDNDAYCEKVVHIKFNAWHYSDTNLWASLVNKIFSDLHTYLENKTDAIPSELYTQLISVKMQTDEKIRQCGALKKEKKALEANKNNLHTQKMTIQAELQKLYDISGQILQDPEVKNLLKNFKDDLSQLKGLEDVQKLYDETTTFSKIFYGAFKLFRESVVFQRIVFIFIIGVTFFYYFSEEIKSLFALTIVPSVILANSFFKNQKYVRPLQNIINNWSLYHASTMQKNTTEQAKLVSQIYELEYREKELKGEIEEDLKQMKLIESEIKEIKSGKRMALFIEERYLSVDYHKHLGLISTIRDDLEELTNHIIRKKDDLDKDAPYKIDRIILYIDDLDRCQPEKVVQVLEAIHLLLAFELFVVIVGVDTRWVSQALSLRMPELLSSKTKDDGSINIVDTSDYLEKIFQIPFHLKTMDLTSKVELIESLLHTEIVKESLQTDIFRLTTNEHSKLKSSDVKNILKNDTSTSIHNESIDHKHARLQITQEELTYIAQIIDFVGDTPRTIKRFINIYRIIRTHENLKEYSSQTEEEYKAIICLLAIVFRKPEALEKKEWNEIVNNIKENEQSEDNQFTFILEKIPEYIALKHVDFIKRFTFKSFE